MAKMTRYGRFGTKKYYSNIGKKGNRTKKERKEYRAEKGIREHEVKERREPSEYNKYRATKRRY